MPIVRIRALPQQDGVDVDLALAAVTRALAELLGDEPRRTWATWETARALRLEPGNVWVRYDDVRPGELA